MTSTYISDFPDYKDAHMSHIEFPVDDMNKIQEWVKNPKFFLILTGNHGVGKTYFCAALENYLKEKNKKSAYYTEDDFFGKLKLEMDKPGGNVEYKASIMASYDLIFILDELGNGMMSQWNKTVIKKFIDHRLISHLPLVICSNTFMKDMGSVFNSTIASRLSDGRNTVIELYGEDGRPFLRK